MEDTRPSTFNETHTPYLQDPQLIDAFMRTDTDGKRDIVEWLGKPHPVTQVVFTNVYDILHFTKKELPALKRQNRRAVKVQKSEALLNAHKAWKDALRNKEQAAAMWSQHIRKVYEDRNKNIAEWNEYIRVLHEQYTQLKNSK